MEVRRTLWFIVVCLYAMSARSQQAEEFAPDNRVTYKNAAAPIEDRVNDLLARMTVEEKVSQMRMFHRNQGIEISPNVELELSDVVKQRLANGIGGIKNPGEHLSPELAASLNNQLQKYVIENNRLGIPVFFRHRVIQRR